MSMEPVAWAYKFKGKSPVLTDEKKDWAVGSSKWTEEPLVRLSDAEARIAELQAKIEWLELEAEGHDNGKRDLAEVLNCADEPRWKHMRLEAVKLKARAEAAEALLKEAGEALEPFSMMAGELFARNWEDNGVVVMFDEAHKLTFKDFRAARAIHDKIGGKDE